MTTIKYNAVDLSTYGIVTVIDGYLDAAGKRGANQVVPFRDGTIFTEKYFDERIIPVGIAVTGADAAALETAMDSLRGFLYSRTAKTLEITFEDSSVKDAPATVNRPLNVTRESHRTARAVIEFILTRPFFRSTTAIDDNTETIDASPTAMTVTNPGTVEERDPVILLTGPLENTVITNSTNGYILTYTGVIDDGDTVTIQTDASGEYTAVHSVDGNVIGNVTHSGGPALMVLNVGDNVLSIADDEATTGTVKISFYAPFA